ncbi:hypothetical protein ACQHIV_16850 [Kribbella sp. GL6]|uniref:hypothetical protein n=1 Tax=Kribbella sp. GL6 TaxID=3419765 RepID=UPI003D075AB4
MSGGEAADLLRYGDCVAGDVVAVEQAGRADRPVDLARPDELPGAGGVLVQRATQPEQLRYDEPAVEPPLAGGFIGTPRTNRGPGAYSWP